MYICYFVRISDFLRTLYGIVKLSADDLPRTSVAPIDGCGKTNAATGEDFFRNSAIPAHANFDIAKFCAPCEPSHMCHRARALRPEIMQVDERETIVKGSR